MGLTGNDGVCLGLLSLAEQPFSDNMGQDFSQVAVGQGDQFKEIG